MTEFIGEINEAGFLKTFEYKGICPLAGFDEIISNSYDAKASKVIISIILYNNNEYICISDNGNGINNENINFMFSMYKQKIRKNEIGMANAGSKYAFYNLSNKTHTIIITYTKEEIKTICIDWNKMINEGKYTGNIDKHSSSNIDIEVFNKIMPNRNSGTTILFPYSKSVWEIIKNQFIQEKEIKIEKSLSFRYGFMSRPFNIVLINNDIEYILPKYNPLNKNKMEERRIDIITNGIEIRYITDKNEEIRELGNGFSKTPIIIKPQDIEEYKLINTIHIILTLPHDDKYKKDGSIWYPPIMNNIYIHNSEQSKFEASSYPIIVRNSYALGFIPINIIKPSSARGGYDTRIYFDILVQCFYIQDTNTNIDYIIGTQENKGQLQDNIPIQIKRLIHAMKLNYIENLKPKEIKVQKSIIDRLEKMDPIIKNINTRNEEEASIIKTKKSKSPLPVMSINNLVKEINTSIEQESQQNQYNDNIDKQFKLKLKWLMEQNNINHNTEEIQIILKCINKYYEEHK